MGSSLPRFTIGQVIILSEQGKQTDAVSFSLSANCFKQELCHNLSAFLLPITHDVLKSYCHKRVSMGNFHLTIKRKCILKAKSNFTLLLYIPFLGIGMCLIHIKVQSIIHMTF